MKKNRMMRLASLILVLTILSTCAISGTFAKYVTGADADESARVAKWGVTVAATSDAFKVEYAAEDEDYTAGVTVKSSAEDDVVAPGTKGGLAAVALTGTPEVAVRISYTATLDLGDGWMVNDTFYCPLVFTVGETTINGLEKTSVEELETAVNNAVNAYTENYAPGTDLSTLDEIGLNVSWEWPFSTSDANDVKDTALGDAAAAGNAATIALDMRVTATQID